MRISYDTILHIFSSIETHDLKSLTQFLRSNTPKAAGLSQLRHTGRILHFFRQDGYESRAASALAISISSSSKRTSGLGTLAGESIISSGLIFKKSPIWLRYRIFSSASARREQSGTHTGSTSISLRAWRSERMRAHPGMVRTYANPIQPLSFPRPCFMHFHADWAVLIVLVLCGSLCWYKRLKCTETGNNCHIALCTDELKKENS